MPPPTPSFQPLYLQIKALLEQSLEAGEWRPGEAIPSEIELARRFGVSQGTVRKAIDALAADNLVVRRQGKGTFVATHTEEKASSFRFLRIRRNDGEDEYPASRLHRRPARRRRARRSRGCWSCKPGDRGDRAAPRARLCRRARGARRDHAAGGAVRGPHQGALDAYHGSMYSFFETQFGVRMLQARGEAAAVAADAASAAS